MSTHASEQYPSLGQRIDDLRDETRTGFDGVRTNFEDVRTEMRTNFADVRAETRGSLADLRAEMQGLRLRLDALLLATIAGLFAVVATLVVKL